MFGTNSSKYLKLRGNYIQLKDSIIETLNRRFPEAEDCRLLYRNFKDLNEFLMNDSLRKRDTGKEDDNLLKISTGKIGR